MVSFVVLLFMVVRACVVVHVWVLVFLGRSLLVWRVVVVLIEWLPCQLLCWLPQYIRAWLWI